MGISPFNLQRFLILCFNSSPIPQRNWYKRLECVEYYSVIIQLTIQQHKTFAYTLWITIWARSGPAVMTHPAGCSALPVIHPVLILGISEPHSTFKLPRRPFA